MRDTHPSFDGSFDTVFRKQRPDAKWHSIPSRGLQLASMSDPSEKSLAALATEQLNAAFGTRVRPSLMSDSMQLSDQEYAEVMSFEGMDWREIGFDQIQRNPDAVFWFAPETFCYFLPGFLSAGLREGRTDTNAYDALIGMLDRSPEPAYWDDFFAPRWTRLNDQEIDAVVAWVNWLQEFDPGIFFHHNTFARVQGTLALLKMQTAGSTT